MYKDLNKIPKPIPKKEGEKKERIGKKETKRKF
jgi:hypothetical protein